MFCAPNAKITNPTLRKIRFVAYGKLGEVEGVGGEVKGGQLVGEGVPLMVAP